MDTLTNHFHPFYKTTILTQFRSFKSSISSSLKNISFCSQPASKQCLEAIESTKEELIESSPRTEKLRLNSQVYVIPHPQKQKKGGEDAFFVSKNGLAIGVSDGVGGWSDRGIDPSLYSKTLMRETKLAYEELNLIDPLDSLKSAAKKANKILGSATACILSIDETGQHTILKSANLGDSGYMLIRNGCVLYRTKEQQFNFNFPYQLGATSRAQPSDADLANLELREGDKIVLGTDGLFDNLFDSEILEIVNSSTYNLGKKNMIESIDIRESIAEQLAKKAYEKSKNPCTSTPFSQHAKVHGIKVPGGKLDDITVVFATVKDFKQNIQQKSDQAEELSELQNEKKEEVSTL